MKLALYGRPLSEAEARQFINDDFAWNAADVAHLGVLCRADDDTVIGFAGLLPCAYFSEELELGYVLAGEAHRQGYATEIGKELVDLGFTEFRNDRLLALCEPRNHDSAHVLDKLGFLNIKEIPTADRGQRAVYELRRSRWLELRE